MDHHRMGVSRREFVKAAVGAGMAAGASSTVGGLQGSDASAGGTGATWPKGFSRVWVGADYWANRLQDWRIQNGRLECVQIGASWPMRSVHMLTRRLGAHEGRFQLEVRTGVIESSAGSGDSGAAAGFLIGAGGEGMEYRAAALVHHNPGPGGGILAGANIAGEVFFRRFTSPREWAPPGSGSRARAMPADVTLRLEGVPGNSGLYRLSLSALDSRRGRVLGRAFLDGVEGRELIGNVALVSHPGSGERRARFWFEGWSVSGAKIEEHPERLCGPVLCTQYTVHSHTLKLTAQLMPVADPGTREVTLEVLHGKQWRTIATTRIVVPGYTAHFRVPNWDSGADIPFRVACRDSNAPVGPEPSAWQGIIRRDPADKQVIVLAALSCVEQVGGAVSSGEFYRWTDRVWFPHHDLTPNVRRHDPDLLFFAGDQLYEGNPTPAVREPVEESMLDYLYKWYLWCWAFRDLTRDRPTVTVPDDHDVYQGNIWGMGGRAARAGDRTGLYGGYGMPPEWLNMMHRTQTSHLPDPYDPEPVEQGISVYYTSLVLGRIGFAILEDRKFKSSPTLVKAEMSRDSHITEKDYDTRMADVPGAELMGERQLKFIREFAQDWRGQEMKAALSQTIFCNLQISSRGETAGQLDKDLDSGGWPQTGRRRALEELRRGFIIHIAGDQHLASAVHHGTEDFEDSIWSLCVPAAANLYPRFWNPDYPPLNHRPGMPPFTGRYTDGFHNRITVHAVANPVSDPQPGQFPDPVDLHRKAAGYGIVRFDKRDRTITMEVWPRYVDPTDPATGAQYTGWPITIRQADNYGRQAVAWLPEISIRGLTDPVIQVVDELENEILYTLRIRGNEIWPKVFHEGTYTVRIGEPETGREKILEKVETVRGRGRRVQVEF